MKGEEGRAKGRVGVARCFDCCVVLLNQRLSSCPHVLSSLVGCLAVVSLLVVLALCFVVWHLAHSPLVAAKERNGWPLPSRLLTSANEKQQKRRTKANPTQTKENPTSSKIPRAIQTMHSINKIKRHEAPTTQNRRRRVEHNAALIDSPVPKTPANADNQTDQRLSFESM